MPPGFVLLHALLAAAAAALPPLACRRRPRLARALLGVGLLVLLPLQLALARWPWLLAASGWPDVVFVSELHVPLALLLAGSAVLAQEQRGARLRTALLAPALLLAAGAATTLPLRAPDLTALDAPPRLKDGVVLQRAPSNCAAAAAATLVRALGVDPAATERDLAALCLTRPDRGTSDLGLLRGLSRACPGRTVRFVTSDLADLRTPCLVFCGLAPGRVEEPLRGLLRDQAGWAEGVSHAVVLFAAHEHTVEVGDPRFGRERWPREHFAALWDGRAVVVQGPLPAGDRAGD